MRTRNVVMLPDLSWGWSAAARGVVIAVPAAVVAMRDPEAAAALAIGLMCVAPLPMPPRRSGRVRLIVYGLLAGCSVVVGGVVAQWPALAALTLLVAGPAIGYAIGTLRRPGLMLGLFLCMPLMAVGLSYPGFTDAAGLAALLLAASAWVVLVSLLWPERPVRPAPEPSLPPRDRLVIYGVLVGSAGATCTAIGFALDLEHVGWAPTAALLVMRLSPGRAGEAVVARLLDVTVGALAAIVIVAVDPPAIVFSVAIMGIVVLATATAGSEWYVVPTFTTFLVFLLLLVGDAGASEQRLVERLLDTALGLGVAALLGLLVPALLERRPARHGAPSSS